MLKLALLSFSFFPLFYSQVCDDCTYGCCNIYGSCAASSSTCYCKTSTCLNKCCVDERCGSDNECSTSSTLAIVIVLISIFGACVLCFTFCLCLTRIKRRNLIRNRIRNDADAVDGIPIQQASSAHNGKSEGVPIENVYLGEPVEFPMENGVIMEGEPIRNMDGR